MAASSCFLRLLVSFLSVVVTHLEVEEHLPRIVAFVKEVQVIWRKKRGFSLFIRDHLIKNDIYEDHQESWGR